MPFALKNGKYKKRLALFLYQKKIICNCKLIITASLNESLAVLNFNSKANCKNIPYGIDLPFLNKRKKSKGIKIALFLGRYNKTKGIDQLLKIWTDINPSGWELVIAGIIEDANYFKKLKDKTIKCKYKNVSLIGPVIGTEKDKLFQSARLFILPTKTENFGIVVLEALSYGIPVITTNAAPWETLNKKSIGWCIEIDEISLKKAIKDATSLEISKLEKMGNESRKYASEYFNWDDIANEYVKAYKAII